MIAKWISPGIWLKTFHETGRGTLLFGLALFAFSLTITLVIPSFYDQLAGHLLQSAFFQSVLRALLGTSVSDLGPAAMNAMGWVHPVVLCLIWAQAVVFCTRMPVGEVDRGTADVLFALPVTRWQVYRTETSVALGSGAFMVLCLMLGNRLGWQGEEIPPLGPALWTACNLFAVYVAVVGLTFFVSARSVRRGRAMGVVFALVLTSFFLSFLTQFWKPAEAISWVGLLHYYRPLEVMTQDGWPMVDIVVLSGIGAILWLLGGCILARRDL